MKQLSEQTNGSTSTLRLQLSVFALVASSFTTIYITQPVLPVLQQEFNSDLVHVSLTVSATILGMALATLPFGILVDRFSIKPIVFVGGISIAIAGILASYVEDLNTLIALRFIQGLFIPALSSSLAAYLAKSLPVEKLSIVMGSYVAATVCGGLGGRLLGGWIHIPLHWRYALFSAAILMLVSVLIAIFALPSKQIKQDPNRKRLSFLDILSRWELWRSFITAFGGFFVFSSLFNYLPFRLSASPFELGTDFITGIYLVYIMGIFIGPVSGRVVNKYGSGFVLLSGTILIFIAIMTTLLPSVSAIIFGLFLLCAGFFAIHAAAVGSLNSRLTSGQGRANALYVLIYYVGGWVGISLSGLAYDYAGWNSMISLCSIVLLLPILAAIGELRDKK